MKSVNYFSHGAAVPFGFSFRFTFIFSQKDVIYGAIEISSIALLLINGCIETDLQLAQKKKRKLQLTIA